MKIGGYKKQLKRNLFWIPSSSYQPVSIDGNVVGFVATAQADVDSGSTRNYFGGFKLWKYFWNYTPPEI